MKLFQSLSKKLKHAFRPDVILRHHFRNILESLTYAKIVADKNGMRVRSDEIEIMIAFVHNQMKDLK